MNQEIAIQPADARTPLYFEDLAVGIVKLENGGTIVIPDANGVYALELGCNTDGTVKMNVITL